MGIFTIAINGYLNLPPTVIGSVTKSIDYNTEHIFSVSNFTTETTPIYSDPEGDSINSVKILSLPAIGVLKLNEINVTINQEIPVSSILTNDFKYVSEVTNIVGYTDTFSFDLSDAGSLSFSGLTTAVFTFNVDKKVNLPPSVVGDKTENVNYGASLVFTSAMFTSLTTPAYVDPEGDSPYSLKITSLPSEGFLKLNGANVSVNDEILFSVIDTGVFRYISNTAIITAGSYNFNFQVSDTGSNQFT